MAKKKKKSTMSQMTPRQKTLLQQLKRLTKACITEGTAAANALEGISMEAKDLFTNRQMELAKQYFKLGVESNIIGYPEDEVMSDNVIRLPDDGLPDTGEMIGNLSKTMTPDEMMLYMVPCFKTGVLVNPEGQSNQYTQWDVGRIDLDKKIYEVTLHAYTKAKDADGVWSPSIRVHTVIDFHDFESVTQSYMHNDCMGLADVVTAVPYGKLNWSPFDVEIWKNTMVTLAKTQADTWPERHGGHEFHEDVVYEFCQAMTYVNVLLSQNKAKIKPSSKPADDGERKTQARFDPEKQAERKVRTIGPVSIKSRSVPHTPTKKSVIRYTMESWNRRGHMRHYKSGKVVYIKPTTPHRHALKDTESKPAPTTLNIRND